MASHTITTTHGVVHPRHHHRSVPPLRYYHGRVVRVTAAAATSATSRADTPSAAFWDYNLLFRSQRAESRDPVQLRVVEGAVPPDFPAGTYYLAGPGLFSDDHGSTVHPLDGHGYLRAFRFDAGRAVRYSARYVETAAKREEHVGDASWRFTHRGPFSVLQGGTRVGNVKVMKNVANTSVLRWGGRLLCLWEGGEPYELHPRTLETVGAFDLLREVARDHDTETTTHRRRPWLREAGIDVAATLLRPILGGMFNRLSALYCATTFADDRMMLPHQSRAHPPPN
jgi:9-cis-beta-carotene 9',10'-cleaving dioxygenase